LDDLTRICRVLLFSAARNAPSVCLLYAWTGVDVKLCLSRWPGLHEIFERQPPEVPHLRRHDLVKTWKEAVVLATTKMIDPHKLTRDQARGSGKKRRTRTRTRKKSEEMNSFGLLMFTSEMRSYPPPPVVSASAIGCFFRNIAFFQIKCIL
jgi:hypothetical protein